jgi:hypothetical protein
MIGSPELHQRVARLITGFCLLAFLPSVCGIGCGIGKPPVMTLEQWQAQDARLRSSGDSGHNVPSVICPTWRRGTTLVRHPGVLNVIGRSRRYAPALMTAC